MGKLKSYIISSDVLLGLIDLDILHSEVSLSNTVSGFIGFSMLGDSLVLEGESFIDEVACDLLINNHDPLPLSVHKKNRFSEIDKRTGELIDMGFTYDSKLFSLSNNAQLNLLGIDIKRNDGILPITFNTIDDLDEITFSTAADVDNFFMAALGTKKAHLDSGTALKLQVRNAIDKATVDAVIDNR